MKNISSSVLEENIFSSVLEGHKKTFLFAFAGDTLWWGPTCVTYNFSIFEILHIFLSLMNILKIIIYIILYLKIIYKIPPGLRMDPPGRPEPS